MLNDRGPDPYVCTVQSDRLAFILHGCLVAVYLREQEFLEFSFPLEFFILHSSNREADDVQIERKGS